MNQTTPPFIAVACGGTGGHLFPGMAVGAELKRRGCAVALMISPKTVDQHAANAAIGMDLVTLPAVGLVRGRLSEAAAGFWRSYRVSSEFFGRRPPRAVLGMGGFTSIPPILAAKRLGAATFLHEANSIPGRANRWIAPWVDEAFVYFPETASRIGNQSVTVTGMPVRSQFAPMDVVACRVALGLRADRPVLLVLGGSQGARGVNSLVLEALPELAAKLPELQYVHLTGEEDQQRVKAAYVAMALRAVVHPFLSEMELALGAATVAVSRAGASSLAELAAMRVPPILIPYPSAADDHQFHNAQAFVGTGAAHLLRQQDTNPRELSREIATLVTNASLRTQIAGALARWHQPGAATAIAQRVVDSIGETACQGAIEQVQIEGPTKGCPRSLGHSKSSGSDEDGPTLPLKRTVAAV